MSILIHYISPLFSIGIVGYFHNNYISLFYLYIDLCSNYNQAINQDETNHKP